MIVLNRYTYVKVYSIIVIIFSNVSDLHASQFLRKTLPRPPAPKNGGYFPDGFPAKEIGSRLAAWEPSHTNHPWELSGLFEGDIMLPKNHPRNGLLDEDSRWPGAVVPYYIEENDFSDDQIDTIHNAIKEYHSKTCIIFRPYKKNDDDYVVIRSNDTGCWSSVGRQKGGQLLNLQVPGCVQHGVVIHEMLHALGFFHMQSDTERDHYVKIHYENIEEGKESNFNKYNTSIINSFCETYDYSSIMHYSSKAFSKNGEITIEVLEEGVKIGQRDGLSKKDISKLQTMYKTYCTARPSKVQENETSLFSWLFE